MDSRQCGAAQWAHGLAKLHFWFWEYMEVLESADWPQQVEELSDQNEQGFGGGVYISTGQVRGLKPRAAAASVKEKISTLQCISLVLMDFGMVCYVRGFGADLCANIMFTYLRCM